MARIILVTGGVRSGKSSFAEKLMLDKENVVYIATSPRLDSEMDERIKNHQQRRADFGWQTIEEEVDIQNHLNEGKSYLVECLTLWVNNLMYQAEKIGQELNEVEISSKCQSLLDKLDTIDGTVLFVTNETGMGIMPINKAARQFGDFAGRCNQMIAEAASEVYLMVSGIPMKIKGE